MRTYATPSSQESAITTLSANFRASADDSSALRALWRSFIYCWRDPDSSPVAFAHLKDRQHSAFLQLIPINIFDCVVCSVIVIALFWNDADHHLLLAWCGAVMLVSGINFALWQRGTTSSPGPARARIVRFVSLGTTLLAILFAAQLTYLFEQTEMHGKILLAAFFGTTMAHGAFHNARWPWAGILWASSMGITGTLMILWLPDGTFSYLALLIALYSLSIDASVLITSRLFVKRVIAEFETERQRELISLLLNDFETDASDWLWETDARGRLIHVSPRLAEVFVSTPKALIGQSLPGVIAAWQTQEIHGATTPATLEAALSKNEAFRDIEILVENGNGCRRYALCGKPIFDAYGRMSGWRGVGTDITARHDLLATRETAARIAGELDTARRIQMGLLPVLGNTFAGEARFSVAALLEPASEVGGDFYECFRLDSHRICFAIADVAGTGVPASIFMAVTKSFISSIARSHMDFGQTVRNISAELDRNNPEMLFVTAFIAILDADSGKLDYVSAGHAMPFLLRNGKITQLDGEQGLGPPLCGVADYPYTAQSIHLQPEDTLCLHTDGVHEAACGSEYLGLTGVVRLLSAQPMNWPVAACARALRDEVRNFEAGNQPTDDLAIMMLRWHGTQRAMTAPAIP